MLSIEELRKRLLAHRHELFEDAARTQEDLKGLEQGLLPEDVEQAQDENLIRLLDRMDARLKAEVEAVDRALVRMETGAYGVCQVCGRRIADSRLEALPWADVCLDCAARQESRAVPGK